MEEGYEWYKCDNCGTYVAVYAGLSSEWKCRFCRAGELRALLPEEVKEMLNFLNKVYESGN